MASGSSYEKNEDRRDNLTYQIRYAFGFIKINDIDIVWADGQNLFVYSDIEARKQKAVREAEKLAEERAGKTGA